MVNELVNHRNMFVDVDHIVSMLWWFMLERAFGTCKAHLLSSDLVALRHDLNGVAYRPCHLGHSHL